MSLVLLLIMAAVLQPVHAGAEAGEKKAQICLICHKPGNAMAYVPTLEGQTREYIIAQVNAFKGGRRPDSVMQTNVAGLSARDVRDIANYFSSRRPVRPTAPLDPARIAAGKARAEALGCASCHKADYAGNKDVPRIAGLEPRYGAAQILAFVQKKRPHPEATGLVTEDAQNLSHYFAELP